MAPIMSTFVPLLCMTLIVAMAMHGEQIAHFIFPPFTSGSDVVNFNQIAVLEKQFTPTTFPLLFVQQGSQFAHGEWMRLL